MSIRIKLISHLLENIKWTAEFQIFESYGEKITITPFYLETEYNTENEAKGAAKISAIKYLKEKYPKDTRVVFE